MIAELGHLALILALAVTLLQASFPLLGAAYGVPLWMAVGRPAAQAQFVFLGVAFACLVHGFVNHDFSVLYIARNSNSALPLYYRIAAVWSAHEGSMLLWALILAFWTVAVGAFSRNLSDDILARVQGVMGLVSVGQLLFILTTSNPFERLTPAPLDGNDLNPLLQDIGLTVHPPMLYMGYVGLSVAFAFAIAALLGGRLDSAWARWSRPWTLIAWTFLTGGIALGSFWAYYELGWGGWWFWDPVENASFMPWLVATALLHSLAVTEKRGAFKAWTVLLALFGFSLSLLGTFLVRSGVLTSVHAFAADPTRGLFILAFLGCVIGGSLLLYAVRVPIVQDHARFALLSKENLLLLNNVLLVAAAGSVLLGTLYPLVLDALGLGKISVGPPYFSAVFTPLMIPIYLLAGLAPLIAWRRADLARVWSKLRGLGSVCLVLLALCAALAGGVERAVGWAGCVVAVWLAGSNLIALYQRWQGGSRAALTRSFLGMSLAHFGVAVFLVGVAYSNAFSRQATVKLAPGEHTELAGYRFEFDGVSAVDGPNYRAQEGRFRVTAVDGGDVIATLLPQKRTYRVQRSVMTEAAIQGDIVRDLYLALGDPLEGGAWTVRVYVKPMIRWIWSGAVLMLAGGLLAASDRRYRLAPKRATAELPALDAEAARP